MLCKHALRGRLLPLKGYSPRGKNKYRVGGETNAGPLMAGEAKTEQEIYSRAENYSITLIGCVFRHNIIFHLD